MTGEIVERENAPVAIVTGASSGIGRATATALAAAGYRVAVTARRQDRLTRLADEIGRAGGVALAVPADLSREDERSRIVAEVAERWGRIDVLVNNAGFGWHGWTVHVPMERRHQMLAVNVEAVVHLTTLVLPEMIARRSGHVVNVASVAGDVILPPNTLYAATKTFVQAFSRGMHRELRGTGVRVSVVNPGPVKTEFQRVASEISVDQREDIESGVSPERVAETVVDVLRQPRQSAYVPGILGLAAALTPTFGWLLDRFGWIIAVQRLKARERAIGKVTRGTS